MTLMPSIICTGTTMHVTILVLYGYSVQGHLSVRVCVGCGIIIIIMAEYSVWLDLFVVNTMVLESETERLCSQL